MKTLGLIGGIGPESTIEYYRFILDAYREQSHDHEHPALFINSLNLQKMIKIVSANDLEQLSDELVASVERLALAGAGFAAFAANTPHLVFDEVQDRSRIPLISIVEATRAKVLEHGFTKVGLFGTGFTMQASFYPQVMARSGIELITPDKEQQAYIHDKYMNELLKNAFLPDTRDRMVAIANDLHERHAIQALILGGTELPLLLREALDVRMPLLDTTRIHVDRIVREMLT